MKVNSMPKKKVKSRLSKAGLAMRIVAGEKARRTGKMFGKYETDAVGFSREVLGTDPKHYQETVEKACIIKPKKKGAPIEGIARVALKYCHGAGKTWLAAEVVLWFLNTFPKSRVFTTAPTFRQINRMLWPEIRSKFKEAIVPLMGEMYETPHYQIDENWFAMGMSSDRPENIEGGHAPHIMFVIDEAKGVPDKIFDAIEGALTTAHVVLLIISTPGAARGHFYKAFTQKSLGYKTFTVTAKEALKVGLITKAWVEGRKKAWGVKSYLYKTRVLAEFVLEDDSTFFPADALFQAFENHGVLSVLDYKAIEDLVTGKVALGVDVARFGSDNSVISALAEMNHPNIEAIQTHREILSGLNTMELVGKIIHTFNESGAQVIAIDDTGVGGGVTDRLMELGYEDVVVPVTFGSKSLDEEHIELEEENGIENPQPRFDIIRTEMYWMLREKMKHLALIPDEQGMDELDFLESQCAEVTKTISSTDKIRSVKKEGKRYDVLDSLALALHGLNSALHEAEPTDRLWEQGKTNEEPDGLGGIGGMDF